MVRLEKKMGQYAVIAALVAPAWLLVGSTGFAPAAMVVGFSWAWFVAWSTMHSYEKKYRDAMNTTLSLLESYAKSLPSEGYPEMQELLAFIAHTRNQVDAGLPLMKMNRWIGNIEGKLVAYGVVTDGVLGDETRSLFRPLDFGK